MTDPLQIYTIGHSHHEPEDFATLLRQYQISLLVDIRSTPWASERAASRSFRFFRCEVWSAIPPGSAAPAQSKLPSNLM